MKPLEIQAPLSGAQLARYYLVNLAVIAAAAIIVGSHGGLAIGAYCFAAGAALVAAAAAATWLLRRIEQRRATPLTEEQRQQLEKNRAERKRICEEVLRFAYPPVP